MYKAPYFKENNREAVLAFMQQYPFVVLTGCDREQRPVATHIPLLLEEKGDRLLLYGHIQRKTDHHLAYEHNPQVMAIYNGPHAYISSSWYNNPASVSTWNYMAVHAAGTLRFTDDAALLGLLTKTTAHFERHNGSDALVEKMPEEYVARTMKAIIGFEIEVTSLEAVFKLSQNRDATTYQEIIHRLQTAGGESALVAAEMEKRKKDIF